jgi:hypothetical protein
MKNQKFIIAFILLSVAATLSGCRTTRLQRSTVVVDSVNAVKSVFNLHRDSVYVYKYDSIFYGFRNDTVFLEKWHIDYQYITRYDTVHQSDTVFGNRTEIKTEFKEVEKKIYVKWLFWLGLAIPVILIIAWKIFKKLYLK